MYERDLFPQKKANCEIKGQKSENLTFLSPAIKTDIEN